ncbi:MAG: cobalamin biosynthesis protein CbiD, partial [Lachnospiraceae bacterium]|nr:cobalamin biosynthesis protein CbiD [Lachnospiraceae bacterium]
LIDGGAGVGRVTKPGLDQPVGNAAINRVPRQMVEKEVREVLRLFDFYGRVSVEISVPGGEELALSTFNPRLGICGGLSILGTTGIVEPMSSQALLDTIQVECRQKKALGQQILAVSPGNYGLEFMKRTYGYDLDKSVKCSNYIGATIDMAVELGFKSMLLTGHIGKLVKVAGGIMNTHSKEADCRMELLAAAAIRAGADAGTAGAILDAVSTEEGIRILRGVSADCERATMKELLERMLFHVNRRGGGKIQIELMVYSQEYGLLAGSRGAEGLLEELLAETV